MMCSSNVLFISADDFAVLAFTEGYNSFLRVETERSFAISLLAARSSSIRIVFSFMLRFPDYIDATY